jgi:hypothetical protein
MNLLLVEPDFPIPVKSKNHSHFLPIGLLKIGTYHLQHGDNVALVRGQSRRQFSPDRILITSLFTYWSDKVHEAARYYHTRYSSAQIEIGGIYASLMPDHCHAGSPFAKVSPGLYKGGIAETVKPDFSLLPEPVDYQVLHTSRGCKRRCSFCGTWRIEPEFTYKATVLPEIEKRRLVFYDNNLLANPNIDRILTELAEYRTSAGLPLQCESQSGFDLRLLTAERSRSLRAAHFINPRIAWDGAYRDWPRIRRAVRYLKTVGYGRKDIYVFMLYNHDLSYDEMRRKLDACRRWRVRVIDCRFRPLTQTTDEYRPGPKSQAAGEYYIHPNWTDREVRAFRRAVRHQNIAIMLDLPRGRYVKGCEQRKV